MSTSEAPDAILTNARIILADGEVHGTVTVRDGRIEDISEGRSGASGAVDFDGDYLIAMILDGFYGGKPDDVVDECDDSQIGRPADIRDIAATTLAEPLPSIISEDRFAIFASLSGSERLSAINWLIDSEDNSEDFPKYSMRSSRSKARAAGS